jgi:hypothetical protein
LALSGLTLLRWPGPGLRMLKSCPYLFERDCPHYMDLVHAGLQDKKFRSLFMEMTDKAFIHPNLAEPADA